jgi:hypothetical protein
MLSQYHKIGKDHVLPHPFLFIIQNQCYVTTIDEEALLSNPEISQDVKLAVIFPGFTVLTN